jgi:multidrug efflux pump subunit AcrA (membrane-fusion protein)
MTTTSGPGLFRPEALAALDAGPQLERRLRVTGPRSWMILGAALLLVLTGVGWAIFGRSQVTVDGSGALLPAEGLLSLTVPVSGTISDVPTHADDDVDQNNGAIRLHKGDKLLAVRTLDGKSYDVTAPVDAVLVNRLPMTVGSSITAGTQVAQLLPADVLSTALLFISPQAAPAVKVGMEVHLSPSTVPSSAYGDLIGEVRSVGLLPSTESDLVQLAGGNTVLASQMAASGTVRVEVLLHADDSTPSGLAWTSKSGPPFELDPTTTLTGSIIVGSRSPISYLLGR